VTLFVVHWFSGHEYLYTFKRMHNATFPVLAIPHLKLSPDTA